MSSSPGAGALYGIRVLDATNFIAGPYCGMMLADMGADVVKLEAPPGGDPSRYREDESGYSTGFAAVNRNKRSLIIDLKAAEARPVRDRLLSWADVLLISLRPSARERLGLDATQALRVNPRLVYCALSGLGEEGASRDRPAFDTTEQARSGLLSLVLGEASLDRPLRIKAYLADQLAGLYACQGVLGALLARERTGQGQQVDTSLLQAAIGFAVSNFYHHFTATRHPESVGSLTLRTAGFIFRAADDLPLAVHVPPSPETVWVAFTGALSAPELRGDPRFASKALREANYEELHAVVAAVVRRHPRSFWLQRFEACDVPVAPVNGLGEVAVDPVVAGLDMFRPVSDPRGGEVLTVGSGVNLRHTTNVPPRRAPLPGEHSRAVLLDLGLPLTEVDRLAASGVIREPGAGR